MKKMASHKASNQGDTERCDPAAPFPCSAEVDSAENSINLYIQFKAEQDNHFLPGELALIESILPELLRELMQGDEKDTND